MRNGRNSRKHPSALWSNDETRAHITKWHQEGRRQQEIGTLLGMERRGVNNLMKRLGIALVWPRRFCPISFEQKQMIENLSWNTPQRTIAKTLEISQFTVYKFINEVRRKRQQEYKKTEINREGLRRLLAAVLTDAIKMLGNPEKNKGWENKELKAWFRRKEQKRLCKNSYSDLKLSDLCNWLDLDADGVREGLKKRGLL